MRILVYGAGVQGCELAHRLAQNEKNTVTLLARGEWKERIDQKGLTIRHWAQLKTTVDRVPTIETLAPEESYDIVFVTVQAGQLPEILVDGSFSSRAQVSHTTEEVAWTDGGAEYAGTAYTVTVEDPDLEQAAYTVHCRLPDPGKRYDLWVLSEDGWTKTDARLDGQYLLLESQTGTVTFCLTERAGPLAVVILAVGFAGLLIGFCWLIRWRRKGTAAGRKH